MCAPWVANSVRIDLAGRVARHARGVTHPSTCPSAGHGSTMAPPLRRRLRTTRMTSTCDRLRPRGQPDSRDGPQGHTPTRRALPCDPPKPRADARLTWLRRSASGTFRGLRQDDLASDRGGVAPRPASLKIVQHPTAVDRLAAFTRILKQAGAQPALQVSRADIERESPYGLAAATWGGKDSRQNGAGPRPASDINTCVASTRLVPVTAT